MNILIAIVIAVVFVVLLREFIQQQGVFGDWIVNVLMQGFDLSYYEAMGTYVSAVRGNMEIIISVAVAVCFLFFCRFIFSSFMKYFDEVNAGIDSLILGRNEQIDLSPEMLFMEDKLNTLKQTLEKREQDAKLAEQRKNELVMYLAHDIKTPLTSVVGYLSLLDEDPDMPADQKAKYLNITLEKTNQLEKLVDEFFEITRYSFQTEEITKERINLYYMLVQMTDEFYPQLSANGKTATLHVPADMTIYGDPDKLARVFNNILKNAIAYSPDNSIIDIEGTAADGMTTIAFKNEGSIPKDELDSIFDKFYRLDSARSGDTGGAGLGLAISKEIVMSHGGRIYADSGGGQTVFTVELPILTIS